MDTLWVKSYNPTPSKNIHTMGLINNNPVFGEKAGEDEEWTAPDLEDFGVGSEWDQLTEEQQRQVEDNFLYNKDDESPPEDFEDLALPVSDPEGDLPAYNDELSKRALDNAEARVNQVEGVTEEEMTELEDVINKLQFKHFSVE